MHRKQLFIALLLLPLLSAAAGRHSSAPLPAAETAAVRAAAQGQAETEVQAGAAEQATTAGQAVNGGSAGIGGQAGNAGQATFGKYPATEDNSTAEATTDAGEADPAGVDTVIVVDKVQVTAIKQGMVLRSQPVAAAIVGSRAIERGHVDALKNLSQNVPNFYVPDYGSRMTSSIYVRGLGARIDQPVMGLNIDNVPVLNKDNYDMELADAERIEVLRGPQSTLYGRNTMGGVVNVYTRSPLTYEGVRLTAEYGSGDSYRFRASSYYKLAPDLGMAVTGYYTHTGGFFENLATGEKCDWERMGGGRWKAQWRNRAGLRIDNTLSFSVLGQGGNRHSGTGQHFQEEGKADRLTETFFIFRSIIVSDQRLSAKSETDHHKNRNHNNFQSNSHRCNFVRSIRLQKSVRQRHADALHEVCDGCRNADGKNGEHLCSGHFQFSEIDGEIAAFLYHKDNIENITADVADHRCNRCSGCSHAERVNKDRVKNDVDDGSQHCSDHRGFCEALGPKKIVRRQLQDDKRCAECNPLVIVPRILPRRLITAKQAKDRLFGGKQDDADRNADSNRCVKAEYADPSSVLVLFFTEEARNDGTAADAEDVTECNHQRENRCAERYAGNQCRVSGPRDEKSIYHIIDQRHDHAEHDRKCERHICFGHFCFLK